MEYLFIIALLITPFVIFSAIITRIFKHLEFWTTLVISVFGFILFVCFMRGLGLIFQKKKLEKEDYYGEYVINKDYFKGKQTDWQYDHYRFKITEQDSIFFYETEGEKILRILRGSITTTKGYNSQRLKIKMDDYHQILNSPPTTYRDTWSFYLVLNSRKYGNMFFKKATWKKSH